jgi:hypothetical protein
LQGHHGLGAPGRYHGLGLRALRQVHMADSIQAAIGFAPHHRKREIEIVQTDKALRSVGLARQAGL